MRSRKRPPALRASSRLNSAVRAFPRCSSPLGLGAKRVTRCSPPGGEIALALMTPWYGKLRKLNKAPRACRAAIEFAAGGFDVHSAPHPDRRPRDAAAQPHAAV